MLHSLLFLFFVSRPPFSFTVLTQLGITIRTQRTKFWVWWSSGVHEQVSGVVSPRLPLAPSHPHFFALVVLTESTQGQLQTSCTSRVTLPSIHMKVSVLTRKQTGKRNVNVNHLFCCFFSFPILEHRSSVFALSSAPLWLAAKQPQGSCVCDAGLGQ